MDVFGLFFLGSKSQDRMEDLSHRDLSTATSLRSGEVGSVGCFVFEG